MRLTTISFPACVRAGDAVRTICARAAFSTPPATGSIGLPNSGHRPRLNFHGIRGRTGLPPPADASSFRWPQRCGTSIKVTVAGSTVNAFLLYASANQVAAILPSKDSGWRGRPDTHLQRKAQFPGDDSRGGGRISAIFSATCPAAAPPLSKTTRPAAMPVNSPIRRPSRARSWSSTARAWDRSMSTRRLAPGAVDPARCGSLGGSQKAAVQYQGPTPAFRRRPDFNFQLPQNVPQGCYVPVAIKAGGVMSNFTSIAISR